MSRGSLHQGLNDGYDRLSGWARHASSEAVSRGRKPARGLGSTPTLVVRQAVDEADEPVLSLGNLSGGGTATTPTPTTSAPSGTATIPRTETTVSLLIL